MQGASFSFHSPHAIHFGRGQSAQCAALAAGYGASVLIVHGANAARAAWLITQCQEAGLHVQTAACASEPSLPDVIAAIGDLKGALPDVVIGFGGGSVMDFAKALAALLPCDGAPIEYLEVVGSGRALDRAPIPMIALPTTAGTGAEVTKNAVISVPEHQIKVSLRDPRMIPQAAIVDPALMESAPKHIALASGLDAVTQVIEPYVSVKSNRMSDAVACPAIVAGLPALRGIIETGDAADWDQMAWVSTSGGLALANSGLGAVHGLAGVIGGMTSAPHGEVCGALLPAVLALHQRQAEPGTQVHARLVWIEDKIALSFAGEGQGGALANLRSWSKGHGLRGLVDMGLAAGDFRKVAELALNASSTKGNPFAVTVEDLERVLAESA